jgi:hypothetical protein
MTHYIRNIFLTLSSVLLIASVIPYLVDIIHKKTKPRIVSWLNWGILGGVAGAAALADGQIPAAVISFASVIEVMTVVVLGLYYGDRRFEKIDIFCQAGALVGLGLWFTLRSPLVAIAVITLVDLIAALPTYKHIWQKPNEETPTTFVLCSVASLLTVITITSLALSGIIYPVYLLLANTCMAGLIIYRRRKLRTITKQQF